MTVEQKPAGANTIFTTVALLWIIGPLWYFIAEMLTSIGFPGYNYATNFISDLGVPDLGELDGRVLNSPLHAVMNAGFIGEGVLFLLGLVLLVPHLQKRASVVAFTVLGIVHSAGIVVVGLVPGSQANAENGFMLIHGIGAVLAIGCGNIAAIVSARALGITGKLRWVSIGLGVVGLLSGALLTAQIAKPDGVWERVSVDTFFVWQIVMGIVLLRFGAAKFGALKD